MKAAQCLLLDEGDLMGDKLSARHQTDKRPGGSNHGLADAGSVGCCDPSAWQCS